MITANIYNRVFFIKASQYGTAFTIEVDDREYLVSARHLFESPGETKSIKLMYDKRWLDVPVELVGACRGEIDITVFASALSLTPKEFEVPPTSAGATLGQDVYFAGFPYKMWTNLGSVMTNRPAPFIKKGTLSSAFDFSDGIRRIYVDAINNEGFSGAPLVFSKVGRPMNELSFLGVVSGFKTEYEPVLCQDGEPNGMTVAYNTGFLLAYGIEHAVDLIRSNPIGKPEYGPSEL
jgi:hypothetical protein